MFKKNTFSFSIFLFLHFRLSILFQACSKCSHLLSALLPTLCFFISPLAVDLLCLLLSEGIIAPLKAACRLQATSGAFVFEPHCCQQAFGCLLPFPLSNLIAAEKWKPYHTPHGVQKWIFPLVYSQSFSSCLLKTCELQSRGNIRWNLSLYPGHAASS